VREPCVIREAAFACAAYSRQAPCQLAVEGLRRREWVLGGLKLAQAERGRLAALHALTPADKVEALKSRFTDLRTGRILWWCDQGQLFRRPPSNSAGMGLANK
jgi:hypothetical protein